MKEFVRLWTKDVTGYPQEMNFVVYNGQVGISGKEIGHAELAAETELFDPDKSDDKLWVDDGGTISDGGEFLVINPYFSDGTRIGQLFENETEEQLKVEKMVRDKTGQLIADCSGREVLVCHTDDTSETFRPRRTA